MIQEDKILPHKAAAPHIICHKLSCTDLKSSSMWNVRMINRYNYKWSNSIEKTPLQFVLIVENIRFSLEIDKKKKLRLVGIEEPPS